MHPFNSFSNIRELPCTELIEVYFYLRPWLQLQRHHARHHRPITLFFSGYYLGLIIVEFVNKHRIEEEENIPSKIERTICSLSCPRLA